MVFCNANTQFGCPPKWIEQYAGSRANLQGEPVRIYFDALFQSAFERKYVFPGIEGEVGDVIKTCGGEPIYVRIVCRRNVLERRRRNHVAHLAKLFPPVP